LGLNKIDDENFKYDLKNFFEKDGKEFNQTLDKVILELENIKNKNYNLIEDYIKEIEEIIIELKKLKEIIGEELSLVIKLLYEPDYQEKNEREVLKLLLEEIIEKIQNIFPKLNNLIKKIIFKFETLQKEEEVEERIISKTDEELLKKLKPLFKSVNRINASFVSSLNEYGFEIEKTSGGHYKIFEKENPNKYIVISTSPSDFRSGRNYFKKFKKKFFFDE
jgi:hypothetical protein